MTDNPISFRPTYKALRTIRKYMRINGLQGKGAMTRAVNELIESVGKDRNLSDYVRVECFIRKSALKNVIDSLDKDPET